MAGDERVKTQPARNGTEKNTANSFKRRRRGQVDGVVPRARVGLLGASSSDAKVSKIDDDTRMR